MIQPFMVLEVWGFLILFLFGWFGAVCFKSRINIHARLIDNLSMDGPDLNQFWRSPVLCRKKS